MIRKILTVLGLSTFLAMGGALLGAADAEAGWRHSHRGFHGAHRVHFGGPRFAHRHFHRAHFVHRPFVHRAHFVHRPFRRHVVHAGFYGPRFVGAPVWAYGPECVIKRKVRWNRWGERVRVVKRVCY